jgi:hypothetical protein
MAFDNFVSPLVPEQENVCASATAFALVAQSVACSEESANEYSLFPLGQALFFHSNVHLFR